MNDDYNGHVGSLDAPARSGFAIIPSDTIDLPYLTRGIYVGVSGDITVKMADSGSSILYKGVPQGWILPVRVSRVLSTGTSATNLIAMW